MNGINQECDQYWSTGLGTLNVNVVDQIDQTDRVWLMDVDETSEMRVCTSSANFYM